MTTLEDIAREAAKLSEKERGELVSRLLHGLENPEHGVSDEEVLRRMHEAEDDPSVMITLDELASGLHCHHRHALDEAKRAVADGTAAFSDWEDSKKRIALKAWRKE